MSKIRLTIGTKLVGLIAILLIISVASLVLLATRLFVEDNTALIQKMNADTAGSLASQVREQFENTADKMRMIGSVLLQADSGNTGIKERVIREFFVKDKDFLAIYVNKHETADSVPTLQHKAVSEEMANIDDKDGEKALASILSDKDISLPQVAKGDIQLAGIKLADSSPALVLSVPLVEGANGVFTTTMTALLRQQKFVKSFGESDVIISFMVDRKGRLLAHPDAGRVAAAENVSHLGIVKQLLEGKFNNGQTRYIDSTNNDPKLGAFRLVGFAGLGVISEVPESKAFEAAQRVTLRAMYLAGIILCISFFAGYFYSGTITWPIKQLSEAARRISMGDFAINLKSKGRDELAVLSSTFNEMAKGLEERDRVKDTFNKFHNKEIADKLLSGDVKLGGERRVATIFFSDVRGFTGMSETMSPEQVVTMLNEYMTRMVAIIRQHNGVVDKYVGDAIMALWGVPFGTPEDPYNCVMACLGMRAELAKLNELRISRGQPPLKIGMGLNSGSVIAGNIGSEEKMEYTVIGDSVNLASRIESLTKEYGTDFLVSQNTYELVKDHFVWEKCESAKVKGKSNAIEIYKVRGYIDENGQQVLIETPYSSYDKEKSDKVVHDDKHPAPGEAPAHAAPAALAPPTTSVTQMAAPSLHTVTGTHAVHSIAQTGTIVRPPGQWFINHGGEIFGPFTIQEIYAGLQAGEITPTTMLTTALNQPWMPLSAYPEFAQQRAA